MPFSDISGVIPSNMTDSLKFGPEWYVHIMLIINFFQINITQLKIYYS